MFGRLGIRCNHKIREYSCCIIYVVTSVHACSLNTRAHTCTCPPDGFCIAPDTIAYAKVSGADSVARRTQLHLTPATCRGVFLWGIVFLKNQLKKRGSVQKHIRKIVVDGNFDVHKQNCRK